MASLLVKGLIALDDMNLGVGTFTRATSTGGTATLTQVDFIRSNPPGQQIIAGQSLFLQNNFNNFSANPISKNISTGSNAGAEIVFQGDGGTSRGALKVKTGSSAGDVGTLSLIAGGQGGDAIDGQFIMDPAGAIQLTGKIIKYKGITAVAGGVPSEVAAVDLTGQNAAVGTTTLYAVPSSGQGQYRLSWNSKVTGAAGTSSTLGALTITYTDVDGVVQTITAAAQIAAGTIATSSAGNTTATVLLGMPLLLNCKASTNIQYAFAYASNASNAMNYNLHLLLEAM